MKYAREGTTVRLLPGEDARQTPSNCRYAKALGGDQFAHQHPHDIRDPNLRVTHAQPFVAVVPNTYRDG